MTHHIAYMLCTRRALRTAIISIRPLHALVKQELSSHPTAEKDNVQLKELSESDKEILINVSKPFSTLLINRSASLSSALHTTVTSFTHHTRTLLVHTASCRTGMEKVTTQQVQVRQECDTLKVEMERAKQLITTHESTIDSLNKSVESHKQLLKQAETYQSSLMQQLQFQSSVPTTVSPPLPNGRHGKQANKTLFSKSTSASQPTLVHSSPSISSASKSNVRPTSVNPNPHPNPISQPVTLPASAPDSVTASMYHQTGSINSIWDVHRSALFASHDEEVRKLGWKEESKTGTDQSIELIGPARDVFQRQRSKSNCITPIPSSSDAHPINPHVLASRHCNPHIESKLSITNQALKAAAAQARTLTKSVAGYMNGKSMETGITKLKPKPPSVPRKL